MVISAIKRFFQRTFGFVSQKPRNYKIMLIRRSLHGVSKSFGTIQLDLRDKTWSGPGSAWLASERRKRNWGFGFDIRRDNRKRYSTLVCRAGCCFCPCDGFDRYIF